MIENDKTEASAEAPTAEQLVIRMNASNGMINIDGEKFSYSNIQSMYQSSDGHGLQVAEDLAQKRARMLYLCDGIAAHVYALQDWIRITIR